MSTSALRLPHATRFTAWFANFLRQELAPYPGRGAVVARMVIAATISAVLVVTFRIPGGAIGALCAFILSRENLLSTARSALYIVAAFAIGGLFIPIGARFFASVPEVHFIWEAVSLFLIFFLLRTLSNFVLATGLSLVATNILAIWYLSGPAGRNVELTLWQVASALIGALVTLAVEVVFHAMRGSDELAEGLDVRLGLMQELMESYAANRPVHEATVHGLAQYAVVGMGSLRRHLAREVDDPVYRMRMSALVSLVGRAVDFSAALSNTTTSFGEDDRQRTAQLARYLAEIRQCVKTKTQPTQWEAEGRGKASTPLLSEIEALVVLLPSAFSSETSIDPRLEVLEGHTPSTRIFAEDAFTNPDHLRYALAGTLAAMICYMLYVSLSWPGIATSVTTCVLTGLTNIGASRQKQVLRIAGAMLGGFVFGMGSQMFVLPYIDSISGFVVLIASVSAVAAWIGTSSSRLSYAGLQVALAFYLINLSEPTIQTSLTVARDRAIGVLLGITMMWLVFERFYPRPAADEMVRIFVSNLRQMAGLIRSTNTGVDADGIVQIRRQRDQIYRHFGEVNAQADAVPFETGEARAGHMAARDRIRRWQASLRMFYLMEAPLIQFRIFGNADQPMRPFSRMEDVFREECAQSFLRMADSLEEQMNRKPYERIAPKSLLKLLEISPEKAQEEFSEREIALLRMTRTIASVVDRMQSEVAQEPLYAAE